MKNARTIWVVVVVLFLGACRAIGVVEFNDGLAHNIDYIIADIVQVDEQAPLMYTTVNLLPGGRIRDNLEAWKDSRINIIGGSIDNYLMAHEFSQVSISSGLVGIVTADGFTQMDISGGSISNSVYCDGYSQVSISDVSILFHLVGSEFSQVNISGGSVGYQLRSIGFSQLNVSGGLFNGYLESNECGRITIFGSDFTVNGQSIGYGELTSMLGGVPENEPWRHLTGTLASGEPINNDFRIGHYGSIVLIPEPATIVLLGLGTLALSKRRK